MQCCIMNLKIKIKINNYFHYFHFHLTSLNTIKFLLEGFLMPKNNKLKNYHIQKRHQVENNFYKNMDLKHIQTNYYGNHQIMSRQSSLIDKIGFKSEQQHKKNNLNNKYQRHIKIQNQLENQNENEVQSEYGRT